MTRLPVILMALLMLAGCETFEGMGRDVQTAGQAIETEAVEAQ